MIPGVSRSGSQYRGDDPKLSRTVAAEFSFFLAIPTMLATVKKSYDYYGCRFQLSRNKLPLLIVGNGWALWYMIAIKTFHQPTCKSIGFKLFGYYRIALGAIILLIHYFKTTYHNQYDGEAHQEGQGPTSTNP